MSRLTCAVPMMSMWCLQVAYYLEGMCSAALSSFIASDVTGAFSDLPLNCSTMNGASDRAAGKVTLLLAPDLGASSANRGKISSWRMLIRELQQRAI